MRIVDDYIDSLPPKITEFKGMRSTWEAYRVERASADSYACTLKRIAKDPFIAYAKKYHLAEIGCWGGYFYVSVTAFTQRHLG